MTQNRSHAVMQQRHEAHDSLDDFPSPPWSGRALCEHVLTLRYPKWALKQHVCWEPACNRGYLVRPLREYFADVLATDIHDYGWDGQVDTEDFLFPGGAQTAADWVITNPPFRLAAQFIERALAVSNVGVAMLVRTSFLESVDRYETLFSKRPPTFVAQFVERVPMVKGRHDPTASTATSYAWLVWIADEIEKQKTQFVWIPPCRRQLQKPSDA